MRGLHWFRNDLRVGDNTALIALAERVDELLPVFVLDPRLLGDEPRSRFLLATLAKLSRDLDRRGVPLLVRRGIPERVLPGLLRETGARILAWNQGISPFARRRDEAVRRAVEKAGAEVLIRRDDVIFAASELRTQTGGAYAVYTPYRRAWWRRFRDEPRRPRGLRALPAPIPGFAADPVPAPRDAGDTSLPAAGEAAAKRRLARFLERTASRYHRDRDRPDRDGTSGLSPYLRFGAVSVRQCFERAQAAAAAEPKLARGASKWLDELIWREFYAAILETHPRVMRESYRREYEAVAWNDDADALAAWCDGRTGYPIVDAGMRQPRATGWVRNRVRMIVASFLTKDLLIDWRAGERHFFERLADGDPASNNGGWQWSASTGTDAQPYFRIFNPVSQGRRFDPDGRYVRRWIPELRDVPDACVHAPWKGGHRPPDYPPPIVDHAERREEALARYRAARRDAR